MHSQVQDTATPYKVFKAVLAVLDALISPNILIVILYVLNDEMVREFGRGLGVLLIVMAILFAVWSIRKISWALWNLRALGGQREAVALHPAINWLVGPTNKPYPYGAHIALGYIFFMAIFTGKSGEFLKWLLMD